MLPPNQFWPQVVDDVEKPWGTVRHVTREQGFELHHASISAGGFSSRHRHVAKHNHFYVVSGHLIVELYAGPDVVELTAANSMHEGEHCTVPAGYWHRFRAVTDVELIETYWCAVRPDDIDRADVGGKLSPHGHHPG